jgi:DNA-binding transcriptional MerR regulator
MAGRDAMLMAELSRRSGVPVATIKYYLREGLLAPGTPTAATRAEYDDTHLRRLRLIRALIEVGEVPVATIRYILGRVDDESVAVHDMFGTVQYALGPHVTPPPEPDPEWQAATAEVSALIDELGWRITPRAPARALLAASIVALHRADAAPRGLSLRTYAEAMARLAALEVPSVAGSEPAGPKSRAESAESAVVGIVLYERILIALRRLAEEDASSRSLAR